MKSRTRSALESMVFEAMLLALKNDKRGRCPNCLREFTRRRRDHVHCSSKCWRQFHHVPGQTRAAFDFMKNRRKSA